MPIRVVASALASLFLLSMPLLSNYPPPKLPRSLMRVLAENWAGYRPIDHNDIPSNTISEYYDGVLPKVPGIACADFDGNGTLDYALLLVNEDKRSLSLVVAFAFSMKWRLSELRDIDLCPPSLNGECYTYGEWYLEVLAPGFYESMINGELYELTPDLAKEGYVASITSKTPALYWGEPETEGTAFFFHDGQWLLMEF